MQELQILTHLKEHLRNNKDEDIDEVSNAKGQNQGSNSGFKLANSDEYSE